MPSGTQPDPHGSLSVIHRLTTIADLERYNVRTDAWGLITIALLLLIFSDAVPLPFFSSWKPTTILTAAEKDAEKRVAQRYAKAAIAVDVFHHVTTGLGAWTHYAKDTHYNASMGIGVWGCAGLAMLGVTTLLAPSSLSGLGSDVKSAETKTKSR